MTSAFGEHITCSRLSGPKDHTGKIYEGAPCEDSSCTQHEEYADILAVIHNMRPFRLCEMAHLQDGEIPSHQMFICTECELTRTRHWICSVRYPEGFPHKPLTSE